MKIGILNIGQSPRVDVIPKLKEAIGFEVEIEEQGALDNLTWEEIKDLYPWPDDYVLITRMRDGKEVKIARHIVERMKKCVADLERIDVDFIILLCTGEYLPGPKEEVKEFPKEQGNLVNKLVKLNVSEVTAENLIKNNDQELIKKWIEAIHYINADSKAAYLVKAIRENWKFPEECLREKREGERKKEEKKIEQIKIKLQEEENKERQEEIKKIEQIYNSLDSSQQEEIKKETENMLPEFWKEKLNKVKIKGESSKMLEVVLEEKRREIIKEWIKSGRIEGIINK